jgi:hypothetical protein
MVFLFLPAVVADAFAFTAGAAVFHKIQNVFISAASGLTANKRLYAEPDDQDGHHSDECSGKIQ